MAGSRGVMPQAMVCPFGDKKKKKKRFLQYCMYLPYGLLEARLLSTFLRPKRMGGFGLGMQRHPFMLRARLVLRSCSQVF